MRIVRETLAVALSILICASVSSAGSAVVTDGRFTNVYVFPNSDTQTWEQHLASLRSDSPSFSRAAIDAFTKAIMSQSWPTYWDPLAQYNGIHPPQFFGSSVASKTCVDAALKDRHNGLVEWDTVRSLSNCHINGMDPSPQVNLIFSPDIRLATIPSLLVGTGEELCTSSNSVDAYHSGGLNVPNFAAIPMNCMNSFAKFTRALSHEDVEIVSDPAGAGMGTLGGHELGDNCEHRSDAFTTINDYSVARYWSVFDNTCVPNLDPPAGSVGATWVLGQASPLQRFTGDVHTLTLDVPQPRVVAGAALTQAQVVIQTGGDDLRGGGNDGDNARVDLNFIGGQTTTANVNGGRSWENGETHAALLNFPPGLRVSDITGLTLSTNFGGGLFGDNWNVDKVALVVSFPAGSATRTPPVDIVHQWLDASGGPLIRFTGDIHDLSLPVAVQDSGKDVRALNLIISTGNDDLRGGSGSGDNCDVTVQLRSGGVISLDNVNGGANWQNWTIHTVAIPLPSGGLKGGDISAITLHTSFGGGIGGDNWNVQRVQLEATIQAAAAAPHRPKASGFAIQSTFGNRGNFEMVIPEGGRLVHYWRDNDAAGQPWHQGADVVVAPMMSSTVRWTVQGASLIQDVGGPLETVAWVHRDAHMQFGANGPGGPSAALDDVEHYWLHAGKWMGPERIAADGNAITRVTGRPAFIQGASGKRGNFEMVVPEGSRLVHYWRDNDAPGYPWHKGSDIIAAPPPMSVIASWTVQGANLFEGLSGALETVAWVHFNSHIVNVGGRLGVVQAQDDAEHYWVHNGKWMGPEQLRADGNAITPTSTPAVIMSAFGKRGNYEMVVPEGGRLVHYWRDNDAAGYPWHRGSDIILAPSATSTIKWSVQGVNLFQSKVGDLEVIAWVHFNSHILNVGGRLGVVQAHDELRHYRFNRSTLQWTGTDTILFDGKQISGHW